MVSEGEIRPSVSAANGWGWVFALGIPMALVATYTPLERGLWWFIAAVAGWVWGLPYVAWITAGLVGVGLVAVGVQIWRGWGW